MFQNHNQWLYCSKCENGVIEFKNLCFFIDTDGVFLEILKDNSTKNNNNNSISSTIVNQLPNYDRYELVLKSIVTESYYAFDENKNDLISQQPFLMCTSKECFNIIGCSYLNKNKKIFSFRLDHKATEIDLEVQANRPWRYYLNKSEIIDQFKVYKNGDLNYNGFFSMNNNNNSNSSGFLPIKQTRKYNPTIYTTDCQSKIPKLGKEVIIEPRPYQIECYSQCIQKNTLLVLPTGMGKTMIAIMTLLEMYRLNNEDNPDGETKRVALFLVDRVPLVTQQGDAIESVTNLKVCKLYGEINNFIKRDEVTSKRYDVLVSTVGSLVNLLDMGCLNISDFYFITFDEVHHAGSGYHPFNKVIEYVRMSNTNTHPRLLGLTASLIGTNDCKNIDSSQKAIKRIELLMLSDVYKPMSLISDSFDNIKEIEPDLIPFETSFQENMIESQLSDFLIRYSKSIQMKLDYSDIDLESILIADSNGINSSFSNGLDRLFKHALEFNATFTIEIKHLIDLYKLFSVLSTLGPKEVLNQLDTIIENVEPHNDIYHELLSLKYNIIGDYNDQYHFQKGSSRYRCLLDSLSTIDITKSVRIIVFVETRLGALNLTTLLKKESFNDKLNCKRLVGHNGDDGMDSDKQQKIIQKFRDGNCKLIISTNVLEEGIDIQNLDLVICYDGINSLKSLIQRRGRARSKENSKFKIIYNKSKYSKILEILSSENILNSSLNEMILKKNDLETINSNFLNWKKVNKLIDGIRLERKLNGSDNYVMLSVYHVDFDGLKEFLKEYQNNIDSVIDKSYSIMDVETVALKMEDDDQFLSNFIIVTLKCLDEKLAIDQFESLLVDNGFNFWLSNKSFYLSAYDTSISIDEHDLKKPNNNNSFTISKFEFGNMLNPTTYYTVGELENHFTLVFKGDRIELTNSNRESRCILRLKDIETNLLYEKKLQDRKVNFFLIVKRPLLFEEFKGVFNKHRPHQSRSYWNKSPPPFLSFGTAFVYRFIMSTDLNQISKFIEPFTNNGFKIFDCSLTIITDTRFRSPLNLELFYIIENKDILYLLNCLNSQRSFGRVITQEFVNQINQLLGDNKAEQCRFIISSLISRKTKFIDLGQYIKECLIFYQKDKFYEKRSEIPVSTGEFAWIREIYITPSRNIYIEPTLQRSCRVVRHYGSKHFILVKFTDETFEPIQGVNQKHPVFKHIQSKFQNGIQISDGTVKGETYHYIGNSNSQLRDFSAWFVDVNKIPVHVVRYWTEINHIENPRKFFRCMGLMFSTTVPTIRIPKHCFNIIGDIERDGHNFTEGCGEIGSALAKKLNDNYGFRASTCAYQIRIGGAKGMLVVNDRVPNPMGIYIRKSMIKFDTKDSDYHRTLEICSVSTTSRCRLNRQVITLLSTLGTEQRAFFSLQDRYLNQLANIVNDTTTSKKLIEEFFPDITESELYQDSYIRRILITLYKLKMQRIQQKCSIVVDDSRMLLGVSDCTGLLPPNCVFVQLEEEDPDENHKYDVVITDLVMVIKNPCTHPGDVRYLKAVDVEGLRHLKNVLVFSVQGNVPNFKEISGSDLDGDRYFFCYDQHLIGNRRQSQDAYLGGEEKVLSNMYQNNKNVMQNGALLDEIYFNNVERQQLGQMYNSHLAICDSLGATNKLAIEISKECFKEIDYAKTGEHGEIPKEAIHHLTEKGYPHYMFKEGSTKKYYQSKTVMGLMYDQVEQLVYIGDFLPDITVDESKLIKGYENHLGNARILYREYKTQVNSLLRRYRTNSEESLLIGLFDGGGGTGSYTTSFSSGKISKEIMVEMKGDYNKIQQSFENEFLKEFGEEQKDIIFSVHRDNIEKKIAAWYYVAYSDKENDRGLGFYWIARSFKQLSLLEETQKRRNIMVNSILDHMDQKKLEILSNYEDRLSIVKELNEFLGTLTKTGFEHSQLHLIGSTSTLLFEPYSNINLYLLLNETNSLIKSIPDPLSFDEKLVLLSNLQEEIKLSSNHLVNGIKNCVIINEGYDSKKPPLFKFKKDGFEVVIGLETDQWCETLIQQQYIANEPSIMPLLLCIIEWGVRYSFIPKDKESTDNNINNNNNNNNNNSANNLSKSNIFSLFIQFCIDTKLMTKLDNLDFVENLLIKNYQDKLLSNTNLPIEFWNKIFDIASRYSSVENPNNKSKKKNQVQKAAHEEYNTSNLSDIILSFFRYYSDKFGSTIYENEIIYLPSFIDTNQIFDPNNDSDKSTLLFYQESFRHALHSLSTLVNIDDFLSNCFKTTKRIMNLQSSQCQILQDKNKSRDIIKKVQACGCEIFIKLDGPNPTIEIQGTPQQLRNSQNEIRDLISIKNSHHHNHHRNHRKRRNNPNQNNQNQSRGEN